MAAELPTVLVLTPIKDGAACVDSYCDLLDALTYPRDRLSVGLLEGDSRDASYSAFQGVLPRLARGRRRAQLWKRDFGFHTPLGLPRWAPQIQVQRRATVARARNHLLLHALDDEQWVLWIDVDVIEYPPDVIERFLSAQRRILHPHCLRAREEITFDLNAWRDQGRLHMEDLRSEGDLVRLDAVGGTMLWVDADLHRDGLIFPAFPYGAGSRTIRRPSPFGVPGELDTEGFGVLATDMGQQCWGMPGLVIRHRDG